MGSSLFFWVKVVFSGLLIAGISELAKTSPRLSAFITALPLTSILAIIWIHFEKRDAALLAQYSREVYIWSLPGLVFGLVLVILLHHRYSVWLALLAASSSMALGMYLMHRLGFLSNAP